MENAKNTERGTEDQSEILCDSWHFYPQSCGALMGGVVSDPAAQPLCFALSAARYDIADYSGRDRHVSDLAVGRQTQ